MPVTLGLQLIKVLVGVNPASIFAVTDEAALGNVVEGIQLSLVALSLLAGVVLLHRHRSRPGRAPRRPATLVVDAFNAALVMLAALYLTGLFAWPYVEPLRLITFAALGLAPLAFLFALLDTRLARGDVAGMLVELSSHPTTDLQTPLAEAIRDPSLRLFCWLPEQGRWVDQLGEPTAEPRSDDRNAMRILSRDDQPLAALTFDPALEDEYELLDTVLATAGIALENGRLRAELRARLQELKSSRVRVLEAGRRERQRLERDLHDGAQVQLVALSLQLGLLEEDPATDSSLRVRLHEARAGVLASLQDLRDIAHGIYPAVVSDHGLAVALESLIARSSVLVELEVDVPDRPPEAVAVAAYYVVSPGLRGLADRVDALGGCFQVHQAGGVRVHAEIPCP